MSKVNCSKDQLSLDIYFETTKVPIKGLNKILQAPVTKRDRRTVLGRLDLKVNKVK